MNDELTLLQQVKAQAEVLVPLIRRLEAEIGTEKAHSILRDVVSGYFLSAAKTFVEESGGDRMAAFMKFAEVSAGGARLRWRIESHLRVESTLT